MAPSPPSEAQHFRGKTLSPESPLPVHISEPQNIPVLQNQTDPIFNLMSTHMEQPGMDDQDSSMYDPPGDIFTNASSYNQQEGGAQKGNDYIEGSEEHQPKVEFGTNTSQNQQGWQDLNESNIFQKQMTLHSPPPVSNDAESPSMSLQHNDAPPAQTQSGISADQIPEQYGLYRHVPEYATARPDTDLTSTTCTDTPSQTTSTAVSNEGVSYQPLLDTLTPSASLPLSTEDITTGAATDFQSFSPGSVQAPIATLPIPVGLPARPPPQEKPAIHPNYTPGEDIRSYHNPTSLNTNPAPTHNPQPANPYRPAQNYPPQNVPAPNGMAPPPLATFQQQPSNITQPQRSPKNPQSQHKGNHRRDSGRSGKRYLEGDSGYPRIPEVEKVFDEFLRDEVNYTSQGQWERFPQGSRLFVGNLFTEKVTKRDLFYIFHEYGRLAQISMKTAYGFVQFVRAEDCHRAMQSEHGLHIRGRKINLEISKPQKNTRNAAVAAAAGESLRAALNRRSRSPDYDRGSNVRGQGPGPRGGSDRFDRGSGYGDFQPRGRDDYRPGRSPSPRGGRGRDSYRGGRDRSPDRYFGGGERGRSRSPMARGGGYRDRSPGPRDLDDEANLPIARRPPGSAPEVQIILAEEVDRTFVGYIQQSFRDRSLRCEVLHLPRVSMIAVIKRQILEGVQAVVRIDRRSQVTGKIPLQVFNRSQGLNNVQFDEYEDLDATIAAEIVVRAKSTHTAPPQLQPQYPSGSSYGAPQYPQQSQMGPAFHGGQPQHVPPNQMPLQQPQGGGHPSNVSNLIGNLDGPALHNLLASLSQNPQNPQAHQLQQSPTQPGHNADLSAILSNVAQQQGQRRPEQTFPQQGAPQPGFAAYGNQPQQQYQQQQNPNFQHNLAHRPAQPALQSPTQQQPNVQEIMAQLAKYRQ